MNPLLKGPRGRLLPGRLRGRVVLAWHAVAGEAARGAANAVILDLRTTSKPKRARLTDQAAVRPAGTLPRTPSRYQATTTRRIARLTARTQVQADRRRP